MLLLENENYFGYFNVVPKCVGWVIVQDLKYPEGYRFRDRLKSMRHFKAMEKQIAQEGYKGWIAYTTVDNSKMKKLFHTLGGELYFIDEFQHMWFCRDRESILNQKVGLLKRLEVM